MTTHTPGPWQFSTEPQPNGCPIVGSRGLMIAMLAHTVNQPEQKETALANAALIAAAPDLLFELEGLVHFADGFGIRGDGPVAKELAKWVAGARSAIAKATGA